MKSLAPNTMIQNRYLIVQLVGKGGMGEVYLAVDQRLGSAVALKRTFFADDQMLGGAFEREAKTLARLRHPVLPKVSDHFTENGEQYLVMEHIAGDDLSKRLEVAHKPFPLSWVLFWADQLLDALSYLHSHEPPIIHRDIKPQNLKLTDENHIVLLDFGLSKNSTGQTNVTSSATSGSVVGYTPHYAPMEQIRGTGTNPKSDIYALSATLYQLMTNAVPVDALSRADSLLNEKPDPIRPLHEINPEVGPEISAIILKGMEVSQDKRYSNARDMQKALRAAYTHMQEAMSAHTVAFNAQTDLPAAEQHFGKSLAPSESLDYSPAPTADSESPTRLNSTPGISQAGGATNVVADQNSDATSGYDSLQSGLRQSDIKTEVYSAGNSPFIPSAAEKTDVFEHKEDFGGGSPGSGPGHEFDSLPDFDENGNVGSTGGYAPDATVPIVSFDRETNGAGQPASGETFGDLNNAPPMPDARAFRQEEQPPFVAGGNSQPSGHSIPTNVRPRPAAPKKSSSKGLLVAGVLGVLLILGLTAAAAGWYMYSNYYATAEPAPTPTPEPTVAATPSPELTPDNVFGSDSNTNSNTDSTLDANATKPAQLDTPATQPTPAEPTSTPYQSTAGSARPTPQPTARTATVKTTPVPTVKPTQKPKEPNRTVILQ